MWWDILVMLFGLACFLGGVAFITLAVFDNQP